MKATKENIEHRIQLKLDEIRRYREAIKNYPADRIKKYATPYLQRLDNELTILKNELEDREGQREVDTKLGYSRIGRKNV